MLLVFNGSAPEFNYALDILNAFGQRSGRKVDMNKFSAFLCWIWLGQCVLTFSVNALSRLQNLVKNLSVSIPINNFDNNFLFGKNFLP